MSVLFECEGCSLVSHEDFINRTYANTEGEINYKIRSDLFELELPYREKTDDEVKSKKRQRKINKKKKDVLAEEHQDEYALIERLKLRTKGFIAVCREKNVLPPLPDDRRHLSNERVKQFLDEWRLLDNLVAASTFNDDNNTNEPIIIERDAAKFLIPPNCRFINGDVRTITDIESAAAYDLIVLDPPWWNKYVRRSKKFNRGYEMLNNEEIANIPIERLVQPNRTLVAIWCTNAPSLIQAVKQFLPKWKLKLLATWIWIKITKYGDLICEFDLPLKKQPFERLFIACHVDLTHELQIPDEELIFSVPSAIHSHKPPLHNLIKQYLVRHLDRMPSLEIFARYLLPDCTSIGLEVLKLQNLQLFESENRNEAKT